jgi:hypothetical protein
MAAQQENNQEENQKSTLKSEEAEVGQAPQRQKQEPEKLLFSWKAPSRPFKRRDRQFWTTTIIIASIFGLILFLVEGVMPVILVISLVFLFYVLSTVEPEEIEYQITNRGIKMADRTTVWNVLTRFWFSNRLKSHLLVFETTVLTGRLELVVDSKDKDRVRKIISEFLPEEKAPPSSLDRAANWLAKKLPGND